VSFFIFIERSLDLKQKFEDCCSVKVEIRVRDRNKFFLNSQSLKSINYSLVVGLETVIDEVKSMPFEGVASELSVSQKIFKVRNRHSYTRIPRL
jgi:hypothetical protein